jgi:hypothetical protein
MSDQFNRSARIKIDNPRSAIPPSVNLPGLRMINAITQRKAMVNSNINLKIIFEIFLAIYHNFTYFFGAMLEVLTLVNN